MNKVLDLINSNRLHITYKIILVDVTLGLLTQGKSIDRGFREQISEKNIFNPNEK
jgi:hypothetical protein